MLALSGCLYVKPVQERDVNRPPTVSQPVDISSPVLLPVLSDQQVRVWVVANDPDGDTLTFIWNVPRATADLRPDTELLPSGDWLSTLWIPVEWLQDGDSVEVTISDQAQPRHVVTVQWIVEVGG